MAPEPRKPMPTSDQAATGTSYTGTTPPRPLGRAAEEAKSPDPWDRESYTLSESPTGTGTGSVSWMEHAGDAKVPYFYSGDEWKPLNTPAIVPGLQAKLVAAGLLDPDDVRPGGIWDDASAKAYATVLELANRYKVSAPAMLDALAENPSLAGSKQAAGGGEAPVLIPLTNPAELRVSFRETFRSKVGYDPPPVVLDAFVNTYHGMEKTAGQAYNNAPPGETYVQGVSAQTAAEDEVRRKYEADEHAYSAITRQQEFFGMLDAIA